MFSKCSPAAFKESLMLWNLSSGFLVSKSSRIPRSLSFRERRARTPIYFARSSRFLIPSACVIAILSPSCSANLLFKDFNYFCISFSFAQNYAIKFLC